MLGWQKVQGRAILNAVPLPSAITSIFFLFPSTYDPVSEPVLLNVRQVTANT